VQLNPGEIHVWLVEASQTPSSQNNRKTFARQLGSRRWLPKILQKYPQLNTFNLEYSGEGRPVLIPAIKGAFVVDCSASHSFNIGAYGLSAAGLLGIDIERLVRGKRDIEAITSHFFHPQEFSVLADLPENIQSDTFYQYWTLKEAVAKLQGRGVLGQLKQTSFHEVESIRLEKWFSLSNFKDWEFRSEIVSTEMLLSLAVEREPVHRVEEPRLKVFRFGQ